MDSARDDAGRLVQHANRQSCCLQLNSGRSLDQIIRDFVILEFIVAKRRIRESARARSNIESSTTFFCCSRFLLCPSSNFLCFPVLVFCFGPGVVLLSVLRALALSVFGLRFLFIIFVIFMPSCIFLVFFFSSRFCYVFCLLSPPLFLLFSYDCPYLYIYIYFSLQQGCGLDGADETHCLDVCSGYEALIPEVDDFTYRYYTVRFVYFCFRFVFVFVIRFIAFSSFLTSGRYQVRETRY